MCAGLVRSLQGVFALAAVLVTFIFFLYLIVSEPEYARRLCPSLLGADKFALGAVNIKQKSQVSGEFGGPVNCHAIIQGTSSELDRIKEANWCSRPEKIWPNDYVVMASDCNSFKKLRGYLSYPIEKEEKAFPIAFSILMHESAEQAERLLRAIYRPQNVYCIHVDRKSSMDLRRAMSAIAKCFDNVFLASKAIDVRWAEFTVLEAELQCMSDLWKHKIQWKYFINLSGREFPLRTNLELVKILNAYNGGNDVDGTPHKRPLKWTSYRWLNENWMTRERKPPPPHGFVIHKGSAHVALSRAFVDFALHDKKARDLLEWMQDIRVPDEHYFQTLNHQPRFKVPGAYKGDPDLKMFKTRFKIWQSETESCEGQWVRFICHLAAADLPRLESAREMFVSRVQLESDPVAFGCMEQWYLNRTRHSDLLFDVDYYRKLPWVAQHV